MINNQTVRNASMIKGGNCYTGAGRDCSIPVSIPPPKGFHYVDFEFNTPSSAGNDVVVNEKPVKTFPKSCIKMMPVGDKPLYVITDLNQTRVIFDDKVILSGDRCDMNIREVVNYRDKPAILASEKARYYILYDGKKIGEQYEWLGDLRVVRDKLAYMASSNHSWISVYDGKEVDRRDIPYKYGVTQYDKEYFNLKIDNPNVEYVRGQLFYKGEKVETNEYYQIGQIREINGKLAYRADILIPINNKPEYWTVEKNGSTYAVKSFIVYDGVEYGKQYRNAEDPVEVDGKLAYTALYNQNMFQGAFIVYDGKEIGREYNTSRQLRKLNGTLCYVAGIPQKNEFVICGDKQIGPAYNNIVELVVNSRGNKLAFSAENSEKIAYYQGFIYYQGQEIGSEYDNEFFQPIFLGDTLAFNAYINNPAKYSVVIED